MNADDGWQLSIGARPVNGGVHFRVWAPAAERVAVIVYGPSAERVGPLDPEDGGYHAGFVEGIGPGTRYRYRLDEGASYPDPASRSQPEGVHGPSEVVDPDAYCWRVPATGSPSPDEALVIYELHVGTFTADGTFDSAADRLADLAELGFTAVEPMPIANFPGDRGWGYDGVNLFAPARTYGGADGFKRFVDTAHEHGLRVILDVVYNHLGPEGNYLPAITGGRFLDARHQTPWGDAVNLFGPDSGPVRDFIIQNALFWLTEYRVDGLRLDATHTLLDESEPHILAELRDAVDALPGPRRLLIAEDVRNDRRLIEPRSQGGYGLDGVWADDLHHQVRRAVAGDSHGYYARYGGTTHEIALTLERGWWRADSGAGSQEDRDSDGSASPGESSDPRLRTIAPERFIHCIQNHDQVGNRATGTRLNHDIGPGPYRAVSALLLLSPYTPLIWMGQEWAASSPFQYFTDHPPELGARVAEGRREEFGRFPAFSDPAAREAIPDPQDEATFLRSKLDWSERDLQPHAGILELYRDLLHLRNSHPALRNRSRESFTVAALGPGALAIRRTASSGEELLVIVNLVGEIRTRFTDLPILNPPEGRLWKPILTTEEARFAGSGHWGRLETDGTVHVMVPAAAVFEATSASG